VWSVEAAYHLPFSVTDLSVMHARSTFSYHLPPAGSWDLSKPTVVRHAVARRALFLPRSR
jgi:hypothetical protein